MTRCTCLAAATLTACSSVGTGPEFESDADVKILFVGNSLTYTHDVPGLVGQLARRAGLSVSVLASAQPDFSLEDHWHAGIGGHITRLRPDHVVMQQGPSSLPTNRTHLVHWTGQLTTAIRQAGAEPALYMVWPDASRHFAFEAVEASYAEAAAAVDGLLLPAGTTWLEVLARDPQLQLYAADGLHASYLGALAAAHTIFAGLLEIDPADIPSLDDGVPAARLDLLRTAVAASLEQWRDSQPVTHARGLQR